MKVTDARRADRTRYLESLLPAHVRERDAATGGLLHALLGAVAGELAVVEADLETLYDSWFVETAPEWVVPYLADLVGLVGLPGDLGTETGAGVSRRAVVANTVRYRQRKGTVAVLEQVVRDVTGWQSKVVEFYRLLGTTTHVNHPRPERPTWASIRDAATAELESPRLASGSLTRLAHTGEVRHVEPSPPGGRGRYDIPYVGVFVFPVQVYEATDIPARLTANGWTTHPLGLDEPLFAPPATEETIEHLAGEADLPVPVRPRRLLAALTAARQRQLGQPAEGEPVPLTVRIDAESALTPDRIRVCGLEDLARDEDAPGRPVLPGWQVMIDAVRGRIHPCLDGVGADPERVVVSYAYGAMADVGAGTYDRSLGLADALESDPFQGDLDRGGDQVLAQVAVRSANAGPGMATSVTAGIAAIEAAWTDPADPLTGGTSVLSVGDSAEYVADVHVSVPAETRLALLAAHWRGRLLLDGNIEAPIPGVYSPEGLRPVIVGDLVVTGERGAGALLDGLVIRGDVRVAPGALRSLTVSQCTVAGRIIVEGSAAGPNRELEVSIRRSIVGGVRLADTGTGLTVVDSVVDPALAVLGGGALEAAIASPSAHVDMSGTTVLGTIDCRLLDVTSSICDGLVTVVDRQRGCARFSYLTPGSRTPRRFRCAPATDAATTVAPSYRALDLGSPYYPSLTASASAEIRHGGEHQAEMGVHHHLRRPQRLEAARRLIEPYIPAGTQIGLFGS